MLRLYKTNRIHNGLTLTLYRIYFTCETVNLYAKHRRIFFGLISEIIFILNVESISGFSVYLFIFFFEHVLSHAMYDLTSQVFVIFTL